MAKLDALNVTFHAKLGTQGERVARIRALAKELAPIVGADAALVDRAVVLAKADLRTEAVGEFPELQGVMGRKYALLQGEHESVAAAIEDHYKPQGPSDRVPDDKVAITVALADKLDTLVGFWAIDEKPTGSKDPFALRRAALGVVRIILERNVRLALLKQLNSAGAIVAHSRWVAPVNDKVGLEVEAEFSGLSSEERNRLAELKEQDLIKDPVGFDVESIAAVVIDLLSFFHDRLKVYLRDQGARYDIIDAVLAAGSHLPLEGGGRAVRAGGGERKATANSHPTPELRSDPPPQGEGMGADDLLMVARRAEALTAFITSEDGINLLAGTKRATQLLAAEEKKGTVVADGVSEALLTLDAEKALYAAIRVATAEAAEAVAREDFRSAMQALSKLRAPVDTFFDDVLVNDEDAAIRANRLALLKAIREATGTVADFSKISG